MANNKEVVICSLARTTIGTYGGRLTRSVRRERCSRRVFCIRCNTTGSTRESSRSALVAGRGSHLRWNELPEGERMNVRSGLSLRAGRSTYSS